MVRYDFDQRRTTDRNRHRDSRRSVLPGASVGPGEPASRETEKLELNRLTGNGVTAGSPYPRDDCPAGSVPAPRPQLVREHRQTLFRRCRPPGRHTCSRIASYGDELLTPKALQCERRLPVSVRTRVPTREAPTDEFNHGAADRVPAAIGRAKAHV